MNKATLLLSLLPVSLLASMNVSLKLAVGDKEVVDQFTGLENAHFRYKLTRSILDAWKGQMRCAVKCNGTTNYYELRAAASFMDLAQKIQTSAMFGSDAIEIVGTVINEGSYAVVTVSKITRGGKSIGKATSKEAPWGSRVRFDVSDSLYVEVRATKEEPIVQKRSGLVLSDDEFEEEPISDSKANDPVAEPGDSPATEDDSEELEVDEGADVPEIKKIVFVDENDVSVKCSRCSGEIPSSDSIHFHVITA